MLRAIWSYVFLNHKSTKTTKRQENIRGLILLQDTKHHADIVAENIIGKTKSKVSYQTYGNEPQSSTGSLKSHRKCPGSGLLQHLTFNGLEREKLKISSSTSHEKNLFIRLCWERKLAGTVDFLFDLKNACQEVGVCWGGDLFLDFLRNCWCGTEMGMGIAIEMR